LSTPAFSTVSVIGLGYVGLPTAATLASRGINVIGVDISAHAVERINSGQAHIIEPDLDMVLAAAVSAGRLRATLKPEPAEAFLIAVPTPVNGDHSPDMATVDAAAASIAPVLAKGNLIIIESTSPVGTTERVAAQLKSLRPDLSFPQDRPERSDILMAYCPERVLPGRTLIELVDNSRLIGGMDKRSTERGRALYKTFVRGDIIPTQARVAEFAKLAENAYRDVNIAFANELSLACSALGVDVWSVIKCANLHPRVNILSPGPGVGGHCIPIDPWFIHHAAPEVTPLIRTAREVNTAKTHWVVTQVEQSAAKFRSPTIALLGLAYKPDIDDLRESPALDVAVALADKRTGKLLVVEPHVTALPKALANKTDVELAGLDDALARADIIVLLVGHEAFKELPRDALLRKVTVDTVGLLQG
jgi:UDP-N-acetyl-D-mannosaminuronic acid dehydrogenase